MNQPHDMTHDLYGTVCSGEHAKQYPCGICDLPIPFSLTSKGMEESDACS